MRKITNYQLTTDFWEVDALLVDGWQPYGSPFLNTHGSSVQAMVKYDDPRDVSAEEIRKIVDANFILLLQHVKKRRDELGACKDFSLEEARLLPALKEFVELIVTYHNRVLDEIHRKTLTNLEIKNHE